MRRHHSPDAAFHDFLPSSRLLPTTLAAGGAKCHGERSPPGFPVGEWNDSVGPRRRGEGKAMPVESALGNPVALALLSALCFSLGLVLTQFGLARLGPAPGALVSVPTSTALLWLLSPAFMDW